MRWRNLRSQKDRFLFTAFYSIITKLRGQFFFIFSIQTIATPDVFVKIYMYQTVVNHY